MSSPSKANNKQTGQSSPCKEADPGTELNHAYEEVTNHAKPWEGQLFLCSKKNLGGRL
jgi:hypothetical protein